jgi:hypothetical protein
MITPVTDRPPADVRQGSPPPAGPKPAPHTETPPAPKSGALSHDQVTLGSTGQADSDSK